MVNIGYFIEPKATPLDQIDFKNLKNYGISDVYIRASTDGKTAGIKYTELPKVKKRTDDAGLNIYAWVWQGFKYAKEVADMGINLLLDLETYDMPKFIDEIKMFRAATKGKIFILCVKPDEWDSKQHYEMIVKYCDYIMPMLYIGDYLHKTMNDLKPFVEKWDKQYPGKFVAALETYKSDKDSTQKSNEYLHAEIDAVKSHVKAVGLFRWGLSKYNKNIYKDQNYVLSAAESVSEFIKKNKQVPKTIKVCEVLVVGPNRFSKMMADTLLYINEGNKNTILVPEVANALNPSGGITKGQLQKQDYINTAKKLKDFINEKKRMPNYLNTPIGNLSAFNIMDMFSRGLKFYSEKKALPAYINVQS